MTAPRPRRRGVVAAIVAGSTPACGWWGAEAPDVGITVTAALADPARCPAAELAPPGPAIADPDLVELSGWVASARHAGIWWAHQDSGAGPELLALDEAGSVVSRIELAGAEAIDWEDLARWPRAGAGPDRLVVADFGDNRERRAHVALYVLDEPAPRAGPRQRVEAARHLLAYPDRPHDAEALLVDPRDGTLWIVTKERRRDTRLFGVPPLPVEPAAEPQLLEDRGLVALPPASRRGGRLVTAGDVAPDGSALALRTYESVLLWPMGPGRDVRAALDGPPCALPTPAEPQGEALGFAPDGASLHLISEGRHPPRHVIELRPSRPPAEPPAR